MSEYIQNLQQSIAQHERQLGTAEGAQAAQIIENFRNEIARVNAVNARLAATPQPSSGGGSGGPPPPPPKPHNPWITTSDYVEEKGVRQADPDIIITADEPISPEFLLELQYEDLSGSELINISRSDIIDGQNVVYSPIKNLSGLRRRYNPNNIISSTSTANSTFSKFAIDLISRGIYEPYFNDNGDLVIEIDISKEDEVIEVEIDSSGTINEVSFT